MTDRETTPAGAVLVAIDISELRNDVLIRGAGTVRRSKAKTELWHRLVTHYLRSSALCRQLVQ